MERKISHEKFRVHSESCLEALEISITNKLVLSETFKVRWDECSNFHESSRSSVQSYTNCMTCVVQSEPMLYLPLGNIEVCINSMFTG